MDVDRLIGLIRLHPELYDSANANYAHNAHKLRVWGAIAAAMNDTVPNCRKQWGNIRDCFRKMLKKRSESNGTKKRKWRYEDEMSFLKPHLKERETLKISGSEDEYEENPAIKLRDQLCVAYPVPLPEELKPESQTSTNHLHQDDNSVPQDLSNLYLPEPVIPEPTVTFTIDQPENSPMPEVPTPQILTQSSREPSTRELPTVHTPQVKRLRNKSSHSTSRSKDKQMKKHASDSHSMAKPHKLKKKKSYTEKLVNDANDEFFQSIACTVKTLSRVRQNILKRRIFSLVCEMEMDEITEASIVPGAAAQHSYYQNHYRMQQRMDPDAASDIPAYAEVVMKYEDDDQSRPPSDLSCISQQP